MYDRTQYDRVEIKDKARSELWGSKPAAWQIGLLFSIIYFILNSVNNHFFGVKVDYAALSQQYMLDGGGDGYAWVVNNYRQFLPSAGQYGGSFVIEIIRTLFAVGYMRWALNIWYGHPTDVGNDVLEGWFRFLKVVIIHIVKLVFTALWSLLLFFPGIIASYSYRQAYYVMLENPDWSPLDCIRASKRLMRGNKMRLFVLDLSFIGWYILIGVTFGIVGIFKYPHIETTYAGFYHWTKVEKAEERGEVVQ